MNENDRAILSVTTLGHGLVHAYELAIPILIPIWMAEFEVSAAAVGIAVAIGYGIYGLGALPGGVATDTVGSMWLIRACVFGMGLAFLFLAFVDGMVGITLALVVWGFAASVYHPAGLRLISTGATSRGAALGIHGIAGNVGIAAGPLLAALLLLAFDWRVVVAVLAIPAILAGVYALRVDVNELAASPDGGMPDEESPSLGGVVESSKLLFLGGFALVFPIVVLEGFFYRGMLTFLPDVLAGYPALAVFEVAGRTVDPAQYVFVGLLFVGMAGQYVGGRLSDRMPPDRAVIGAFGALAVISLAFVPAASFGLWAVLLVSAALGFVLFGEQPLLQALVADYSATDVRGLSYGYMFLGVFGVGALGAAVSGIVLSVTGANALFLLLAVVPVLAASLTALLVRRRGGA